MKIMRRTLCVLLVASAFTAACGDDEEDPPTTVPTSAVTAPAAGGGTSSTVVPTSIAQGVTDGATCSPVGARGRTQGGIDLVCTPIAGGNELRWRPA